MNEQKKSLMPLLFTIAILLIIGAAILYSSNPQLHWANSKKSKSNQPELSLAQLKAQEFFEDEMDEPHNSSLSPDKKYASQNGPYTPSARYNQPLQNPTTGQIYDTDRDELFMDTVSSSPASTSSPYQGMTSISRLNAENQTRVTARQQVNQLAGRDVRTDNANRQQKQPLDPLAPYMSALTKEQANTLNQQLQSLPGAIEAAVLRAFLPKSKKDMNIEKYLSHNSGNKNSPFATLEQQIDGQTAGMVNSMKKAFGNKAASEASKQMENYKHEVMNLLGQANITKEQLQQQTRSISEKYNQKLQEISQKSGLERLKTEREARDSAFQQNLAELYGDEMAGQLGDIMEKYREKDLQLAQQKDISAEEYYRQSLENQRAQRKEMEQTLVANGQSLKGLRSAEDQRTQDMLTQMQQEEEKGNTAPQRYVASPEEKTAFAQNLEKERQEKNSTARTIYGAAGAELIDSIYREHDAKANEILSRRDLSYLEMQTQLNQVRQEANEKLLKLQQSPKMQELRETNQVNMTMDKLMKDPALAHADPAQRQAFEQQARPILQHMFSRINAVSDDPNLSAQEKQQKIQAIQNEAQQQLAGQ